MKANAHPQILKILKQEGVWIDAVSPGEVERARELGFSGNNILFTGTSVSEHDLERVFRQNDVTVTIDSFQQLDLMKEVKRQHFKHKSIKVAVRLNPGIGRCMLMASSSWNLQKISQARHSVHFPFFASSSETDSIGNP